MFVKGASAQLDDSPHNCNPMPPTTINSMPRTQYGQEMEALDKFAEATLTRITRGHDLIGRMAEFADKPRVPEMQSCNSLWTVASDMYVCVYHTYTYIFIYIHIYIYIYIIHI